MSNNKVPVDLRIMYYLHLYPPEGLSKAIDIMWRKDLDAMWRYKNLQNVLEADRILPTARNVKTLLLKRMASDV